MYVGEVGLFEQTEFNPDNQCLAQGLRLKTINFWLEFLHILDRCRVENHTGNVCGWRTRDLTKQMNKNPDVFTYLGIVERINLLEIPV